jgi:Right handed beta helix region
VCFKPAIYRLSHAIQPLSGQTLVFRPGAILNGSEVVKNWSHVGSYWISTGHLHSDVDNVPGLPDPAEMCQDEPTACVYEDAFLDGRPLQHVLTLSALNEPNEVFFDKPGGTIYLAADPTNRLVEATVAGFAIRSSADDVTIRGATIEKFAYTGINTNADRWRIEDSRMRYIHFQAIGIYGGTAHVIENNHIHLCGVIGMTAAGVGTLTVQGNEFDHNNYLHAGPKAGGYHEGAVKILQSHDVVFRDNWSHDNVGDGLWFDTDNYAILIENNVLEHNSRNGLQYEASFDATVRYNTIRDNGTDSGSQAAGILNSTSKNVEYYGNRIEGNRIRSIMILWADRGQSATFGERQSANLSFHDNVIVLDDNPQSWVGVYWNQDPRVFTSNNRFQNNTYYAPGNGEREGARYWRWNGSDLTWAEWQARGFDTTGSFVST